MNDLVKNDRSKVIAWEKLALERSQVELAVQHYFSEGVYARELFIPKGIILTGHIHKYENLNIMTKGKIEILIDGEMKIVEAPFVIVSPPGTKRVARTLEDTIWITVHGTFETNLEKIEQQFIATSEEAYLKFVKENEQFKLPLEEKL